MSLRAHRTRQLRTKIFEHISFNLCSFVSIHNALVNSAIIADSNLPSEICNQTSQTPQPHGPSTTCPCGNSARHHIAKAGERLQDFGLVFTRVFPPLKTFLTIAVHISGLKNRIANPVCCKLQLRATRPTFPFTCTKLMWLGISSLILTRLCKNRRIEVELNQECNTDSRNDLSEQTGLRIKVVILHNRHFYVVSRTSLFRYKNSGSGQNRQRKRLPNHDKSNFLLSVHDNED